MVDAAKLTKAQAMDDAWRRVKLTKVQERVLKEALCNGSTSAYRSRVSISTMLALSKRGLMAASGPGHIAFPSTAQWLLTVAGGVRATALLGSIKGE